MGAALLVKSSQDHLEIIAKILFTFSVQVYHLPT